MKRSLTSSLSWSFAVVSVVALGLASCTPEERNFGQTSGSGGTGGAGGAGGGAMVCVPDTEEPCYSGPPATLEVGLCKSGIHICLPSGAGFGECGGEVLPTLENCLSAEDEACNGNDAAECAPLADGWLKTFGAAGSPQIVHDIAITSTGDIVVVGAFGGTMDLGNGPMASTGSLDIFVAKFDPMGNAIWSKRFGDSSSQTAFAVGIDNSGAIYVGGGMVGAVDFGNGFIKTSNGANDVFLAKFDTDGNTVWAQNFGDTSSQYIRHIAITKTNLIVVAGEFSGTVQFGMGGQGSLTAIGNGPDVFVARFDASGFHSGSRAFGGQLAESVRGLALDSLDRVYITGGFDDVVIFNGNTMASKGGRDAYVAAFSPTLIPNWAMGFGSSIGGTTTQEGYDIAVTPTDQLWVSGGFVEGIDIGQKFFTDEPLSRGLFLARFDVAGTVLESQAYGGMAGSVSEARLAFDKVANHLVVAGAFTGGMDFGGNPMTAENASDPFFAKLTGEPLLHVASRSLPNDVAVVDNANTVNALALLPSGDLIIGGLQRTPIIFGKATVGELDNKDGNAMLGRFIH